MHLRNCGISLEQPIVFVRHIRDGCRCAIAVNSPSTGRIVGHELTAYTECAESKQCHGPKHHYDECVERVTGQIDNDGKASEDCVEECKQQARYLPFYMLTSCSLPPRPLCDTMCGAQALRSAQVNASTPLGYDCRISPPSSHDVIDGTLLGLKDQQDNDCKYRSHVRITVLFPHAKPHCTSWIRDMFIFSYYITASSSDSKSSNNQFS